MQNANEASQKNGFENGTVNFLSATSLKRGNRSPAVTIEKIKAINTIKNDSLKNCMINCRLSDPMAFLTPTSFALFSLLAVLKFIKLMQASRSTKSPTIPNNHTYWMRPPVLIPFLKSPYKCHFFIGCKKTMGLYLLSSVA